MNFPFASHFRWLPLACCLVSCQSTAPNPDLPEFTSPAAGFDALAVALRAADTPGVESLLGLKSSEILTGDPVSDRRDRQNVVKLIAKGTRVRQVTDTAAWLDCGPDYWTFPVPLLKNPTGTWSFNPDWGREEIRNRIIGRNELSTLATLRGLVGAQWEYFGMDPDKDGVKAYAARIFSTPGQRDGLYWPPESGAPASPVGPMAAEAANEGYANLASGLVPYHGYHYRILHSQGKAAPGGAKAFHDDSGAFTGGFAILAWPAEYGKSGVMTFIVGERGMVYEKDLGRNTAGKAKRIQAFQPDASWAPVDTFGS